MVPIYPDQERVLLSDGTFVLPRPFAVEAGKPEHTVGFMPLDALDDEQYQAALDPNLLLHQVPGIDDLLLPAAAEAPVHCAGDNNFTEVVAPEELDLVVVNKPAEVSFVSLFPK